MSVILQATANSVKLFMPSAEHLKLRSGWARKSSFISTSLSSSSPALIWTGLMTTYSGWMSNCLQEKCREYYINYGSYVKAINSFLSLKRFLFYACLLATFICMEANPIIKLIGAARSCGQPWHSL